MDLLVPVKQVSHNGLWQAFLLELFKAHYQFLGVIYDKIVKMNTLKNRAKLHTRIHELLWLRAAELQRKKKYNRMKEKSAKPDQRSEWRSLERPI